MESGEAARPETGMCARLRPTTLYSGALLPSAGFDFYAVLQSINPTVE